MNSDEYNKKEEIVDVPYYTRDLCKDNKFRFARRLIRFENISRYRRIISEMNYGKEYFQTKELKENEDYMKNIYERVTRLKEKEENQIRR